MDLHHPILREFPEHRETIRRLKGSNEHFRSVFDEYHRLDDEVYRIEEEIDFATDQEIEELMARPRHAQVLYVTHGQFWLVNSDGSGKRQLKTAPGQTAGALWIPSGRTLVYLHIPDDPKELITLREYAPDDGKVVSVDHGCGAHSEGEAGVLAFSLR